MGTDGLTSQEKEWNRLAADFADDFGHKPLDWTLGYFPSWRNGLSIDMKNPDNNQGKRILDFGCGQGGPAETLKKMGVGDVHAADTSPDMIEVARAATVGVNYNVVSDGSGLPYTESYFDGAMANYVFITMDSPDVQLGCAKDLYRVLRPDAPLVILGNNPDAVGIRFASVQSGEPGENYHPGQKLRLQLFQPGSLEPFVDTHDVFWPADHYERVLKEAGFRHVTMHRELLTSDLEASIAEKGVDTSHFHIERETAPMLYLVARK